MKKLPDFRAHLGRHGHNLSHDFSFTSSTGHLLTVFSEIMYPKDNIKGHCDMFTRTQPLLNPANVEIDEFIDYFFVPLDMLMSGFGDYLYQINEPYSSITKSNLSNLVNLPVYNIAEQLYSTLGYYSSYEDEDFYCHYLVCDDDPETSADYAGFDWIFFSIYRNLFHNGINPNCMFAPIYQDSYDANKKGSRDTAFPVDMYQPNVLPLSMMAYNAAYEHHYRIDDRQTFEPNIYNIDRAIFEDEPLFAGYEREFFSLKYRPLHLDYFTAGLPSPFFNQVNSMGGGNLLLEVNNYLSNLGIEGISASTSETTVGGAAGVGINGLRDATYELNTNSLRSMFAVEKIMSITQRAKKTYDAQVMAHLGVDVPHDVLHQIIKVGTQHSQIRVGEVVSTAGTADTPLGDIAGKGYSVMPNEDIDFTAPCHGIFIGIYSAVPRVRYYSPCEKRLNITDRLDFFTPEFEKLGLQPIYNYECVAANAVNGTPDVRVINWQMRYEQYKRRFNKVSPAFVDTIIRGTDDDTFDKKISSTFNSWHNWTISRRPLNQVSNDFQDDLKNYLCSPTMLNDLMAVSYWDYKAYNEFWESFATPLNKCNGFFGIKEEYDTEIENRDNLIWNLAQLFYRDPLLHFCKCNFVVVNKMQDNTLPDLID